MSAAEQLEQVITPSAPRAKSLTPGDAERRGARGRTGLHQNWHVPDPATSPKHQKGTPSPRSAPRRDPACRVPIAVSDEAIKAALHWAQYPDLHVFTYISNVATKLCIPAHVRGLWSLIFGEASKNTWSHDDDVPAALRGKHKGYCEKRSYGILGRGVALTRREALNLGADLEGLQLIDIELLPDHEHPGNNLPNYFWPRLPAALLEKVKDKIPWKFLAAFGREGRILQAIRPAAPPQEEDRPARPRRTPLPATALPAAAAVSSSPPPPAAPAVPPQAPPSVPAPADDPPKVSTPPPPPPPAPLPAVRIEPAPRGQLLARLTATRPGWAAQVQAVVDVFALYPEAYATLDETFADRLVRIARKGKWPLRQLLAGLEDAYDKAEDRLGSGLELRDWVITCLKKPRAGTLTASARAIAERAETTIAAARATAAAARPAAAPRAVPVAETPAAAPARVPSADELLELVRRQPGGTLNLGDRAGDLMGPFTKPRFPGVTPAQLLPALRALETRGLVRSEGTPAGTRYWPALAPPPPGGAPVRDGP